MSVALLPDLCGYFLVLDADDGQRYMGLRDENGAIFCWGSHGDDLGAAIDAP